MIVHLNSTVEEFAAQRRRAQDEFIDRLVPFVNQALIALGDGLESWADPLIAAVERAYVEAYQAEGGEGDADTAAFLRNIRPALDRTKPDSDVSRIATWLAIALINGASIQAAIDDEDELFLEWVTMDDTDVRVEHMRTGGQIRPIGEPFNVDGVPMLFPGDSRAPIELWINCRCTLRPVLASEALTAGGNMTDFDGIPWHGVLAPEGVRSGDGRQFAQGALSHRDLPLPLTWQKISNDGHKGNVTVAKIENVEMIDGLMRAYGTFVQNAEADEVVGLLGEFGKFGVSVDADDAQFELDEDTETLVFTSARVSSACIVPIPAFAEAWVSLGKAPWMKPKAEDEDGEPEEQGAPEDDEPSAIRDDAPPPPDDEEEPKKKKPAFRHVDSKERDRLGEEGKALPDGSFPIANKDDLRNAIQAIGRAKDPAAARAHIKKRARALGAEDMIPDGWALLEAMAAKVSVGNSDWSDVEQFISAAKTEDGPGWLTHPVDTDRLRDYWVSGPGAAKIAWGSPGDFNRCRINVAEYVKPQHLNGYCANRHYDALGFWPGRGSHASETLEFTEPAESVSLVASAASDAPRYRAEWFAMAEPDVDDPRVVHDEDGPGVPLTVTKDGQVYGHVARWGTCHVGNPEGLGVCTTPPRSMSGYREFHVHAAALDNNTTVPAGVLTVGGGHATLRQGLKAAREHYDDVSAATAHVVATDGEMGIWVCGQVTPWATSAQVAMLRSTPLSGDWRADKFGNPEMVAAHAVNTPGFPIPRMKVAASNGEMLAMVASTFAPPPAVEEKPQDMASLAQAVAVELAIIQARKERLRELAARVN